MPRELNCPSCGNKGSVNDTKVFEARGKFQGKAVLKCKKCEAGLSLGLLSGIITGNPQIIPVTLWREMEEIWEKAFENERKPEREVVVPPDLDKIFSKNHQLNENIELNYPDLVYNTGDPIRIIKVKLVPIFTMIPCYFGLFHNSILLLCVGVILCLFSIMIAFDWKNAHDYKFFIVSVFIPFFFQLWGYEGIYSYIFTLWFLPILLIISWTFLHALSEIKEIIKVIISNC